VKRDPALPSRLRDLLGDRGDLVVVDGKKEIAETIEGLRRSGVEILGIVGGDGSNLYTLTAATQVFNGDLPPVAFLKGGSVNTIGRSLGLRGPPEALLRRLLVLHANGGVRTLEVETLRVNGYVGFVVGAGLVGNFYDVFYNGVGKGPFDAGIMVAKSLFSAFVENDLSKKLFTPVHATVRIDGREISFRDFTLVLASTVENLFGLRATYRAKEKAGHFHVVASGLSHRKLGPQFHRTLLGLPLKGDKHEDAVARSVEIRFDRPAKYIIDGDLYEGDHIVVEPGPSIRVVAL
jgi:diacylglycerol kinase family enzyme